LQKKLFAWPRAPLVSCGQKSGREGGKKKRHGLSRLRDSQKKGRKENETKEGRRRREELIWKTEETRQAKGKRGEGEGLGRGGKGKRSNFRIHHRKGEKGEKAGVLPR